VTASSRAARGGGGGVGRPSVPRASAAVVTSGGLRSSPAPRRDLGAVTAARRLVASVCAVKGSSVTDASCETRAASSRVATADIAAVSSTLQVFSSSCFLIYSRAVACCCHQRQQQRRVDKQLENV